MRRVLAKHCGPNLPSASGPSWLTFFAQAMDSLWNVDLFRCESIQLRSRWVLVVIDVFTRRIIGIGIGGEYIDGVAVYRMFNQAIAGQTPPARISGSRVLLEFDRSSPQARQLRRLLQRHSCPPLPQRHHARESRRTPLIIESEPGLLCLGTALQWIIRNSRRRLIGNSPPTSRCTAYSDIADVESGLRSNDRFCVYANRRTSTEIGAILIGLDFAWRRRVFGTLTGHESNYTGSCAHFRWLAACRIDVLVERKNG